jgi:uncharacterized protein YgbK (DUF1537 family)
VKLTNEQTDKIAQEAFNGDFDTSRAAARRALVEAGIKSAIAWLEQRCAGDEEACRRPTLARGALADLRSALERGEL